MTSIGKTLRPGDEKSILEGAWASPCYGADESVFVVLIGGKKTYDGGGPAVEYRFKNGVLQ